MSGMRTTYPLTTCDSKAISVWLDSDLVTSASSEFLEGRLARSGPKTSLRISCRTCSVHMLHRSLPNSSTRSGRSLGEVVCTLHTWNWRPAPLTRFRCGTSVRRDRDGRTSVRRLIPRRRMSSGGSCRLYWHLGATFRGRHPISAPSRAGHRRRARSHVATRAGQAANRPLISHSEYWAASPPTRA